MQPNGQTMKFATLPDLPFIDRNLRFATLGAIVLAATVLPARADYKSTVLADSPAAYWRFSEAGVAPLIDTIATNRGNLGAADNGTYVGNMAQMKGQAGPFAGSIGTAFDGTGQNVGVAFDPNMNPTAGPFSVEAWVNPALAVPPSTQSSLAAVLSCGELGATRSGWLIYQASGGWNLRMYNQNAGNTSLTITGGGNPVPGTWIHLAATYDGTTARLYVNGVQVNSGSPAGTPTYVVNVDGAFRIGTRSDVGFNWQGSASEVAYYATALPASTIAAHFAAASTNPAGYAAQIVGDGPLGYWRLNEPVIPLPVAANSGSLGAAADGSYHYWSTTTPDLDAPTFGGFEAGNTVFAPSGTNGIVTVGPLNLNTNTITFECWIKRNGPQSSYAGVLFHRGGSGTATGLDFNGTSSNLGYHWSDQANTYNWVSGLLPPDGAWTYVALAVAPSQAVMYMYDGTNWASAINVVDHPVQAFNATTRIGSDSDASRFYNGVLDEAAIYPATLTEGQLRTHALGGFGGTNAPVLITDPPAITPLGIVYSTTPFSIVADAYGQPPLSFQWLKDGTNVPGATTVTYGKAAATTNDAGNYSVIITNSYGAVTSQVALVTVSPAVPPTITQSPASRSTYFGGTASFTVIADGTLPLSYQWTHAGTNLPGGTNATVFVAGVDSTKIGAYAVTITNVAGKITSSPVSLSIYTPPANSYEATVVGAGPLAYWRLNETSGTTAFDNMGGYDSTHSGGVTVGLPGPRPPALPGFESGNDAVQFDGTAGSSSSPGVSLLNNRTNFTLCGWINPSVLAQGGLFGQNDVCEFRFLNATTIELWTPDGSIDYVFGSSVAVGQWSFLTALATGNSLRLYINGETVATATATATSGYGSSSSSFLLSGNTSGNGDPSINGLLDEVAVYPRALTDAEITGLYAAGAYGTVTAPFVTRNPADQSAVVGKTAVLSAGVSGSLPITYQWKKGGVDVPGGTAATLSIPNVYFTDAGNYVLWATNGIGFTNTAAASLSVQPVPTFANLTNGLVLHLRFDGDYLDTSGRGNDAYAVGSPTFLAGEVRQAVHIATTPNNNYVAVVDNAGDLSFDETASFSLSFWVRYTARFNDTPIIGNALNSTYQLGWVFTDEGGRLEWSLASTANSGAFVRDPVSGSPVIGDGAWHNVIGVVDRAGQAALVYIDGAFVSSWSIAGLGTLSYGNPITIGQDPTGNYGTATFDLDDLGIWRRALTSYEAASVYGAGSSSGSSFDVYGPVKVYVNQAGGNVDVSWQAGTLLQSTNAKGPYTPVSGATGPVYRLPANGPAMFFRVQQ